MRLVNRAARRATAALTFGVALALSCQPPASADQVPEIGGVYEIGIGCTDPAPLVEYWSRFGYRADRDGRLDAAAARTLYGVDSGLRSIRLSHLDSDHGLIRLMVWDHPRNDGLQLSSMKAIGNRWGAMLTGDVYAIANQAEDAVAAGMPIRYVEPQRQVIYAAAKGTPFLDPVSGVREMLLVQPHARQVLFQRYGYTIPLYGRINEASLFRTSQVTHAGLVIQGGPSVLDFYDRTLGLLRARDAHESTYDEIASRRVFDLNPDERYVTTDFDDPRSSASDPAKSRSGRLKIIRFVSTAPLPDVRDRARPGSLGYSLYTYRVRDVDAYRERVASGGATGVTPVVTNELGERSFSFVAPDGYFWSLVEAR